MRTQDETHAGEVTAPNAILDHMRRRISRVGLLVAFLSTLLTALVIGIIFACATLL